MDLLKKTPLYHIHQSLKAQMAPFGSWEMPIQYTSILAEYSHCRKSAALFDICHMGEFLFEGDFQATGLSQVFTIDPSDIKPGRCRYGLLLNDQGGIVDDLIIYRLTDNSIMIVVNSETADNDFQVIRSRLRGDFKFENISGATAKLDLQGPLSRDVLVQYLGDWVRGLKYFSFLPYEAWGKRAWVSRTGYTGELGYELYFPAELAEKVWNDLLKDERVAPAGLGARDILRLEMGYSLYGSDISELTSPLDTGLDSFVNMLGEFTGRKALQELMQKGAPRQRVAFQAHNRRSPRHGYQVKKNGQIIGEVTSGAFSPAVSAGIALALCQTGAVSTGDEVILAHEQIEIPATAVSLPFYQNGSLRA